MGNPLLDIQVNVSKEFLDKYGLVEDGQILAEPKHMPIFDEIVKMNGIEYIPGGATQNTLRAFQWIVRQPNRSVFFGAVGDDKFHQTLQQQATKAGVNVRYQINKEVKTGTCAALIHNHHRSLVADLAAANTITVAHIETPENVALIEKAKFFYVSGFFLTPPGGLPSILKVAEHAAKNNKIFSMNLAAPFVLEFFFANFKAALPYVDNLFANKEEAKAYAKASGLNTENLEEIALHLAVAEKVNKAQPRLVIITQGPEPIIAAVNGEIKVFPVPAVENIVDTNGAGDGFCGGFLAELVRGAPLEQCIKCGCYGAAAVIQNQGCTFPATCNYPY